VTKTKRLLKALQQPGVVTIVPMPEQRRLFIIGDEFLKSFEWKEVRGKALDRHGSFCMRCGRCRMDKDDAGEPVKITVDHVKPRRHFPELALDVGNLQVLCGDCNIAKGSWDHTDWRGKFVDRDEVHALFLDMRGEIERLQVALSAALEGRGIPISKKRKAKLERAQLGLPLAG